MAVFHDVVYAHDCVEVVLLRYPELLAYLALVEPLPLQQGDVVQGLVVEDFVDDVQHVPSHVLYLLVPFLKRFRLEPLVLSVIVFVSVVEGRFETAHGERLPR